MTYRIVTEQELSIRNGEIILSIEEMVEIISFKSSLYKFIDKSILELQGALGKGIYRGKEESIYNKIDGYLELKKAIEKTEKNIQEYKRKNEKK